jgi:hypothetical protein
MTTRYTVPGLRNTYTRSHFSCITIWFRKNAVQPPLFQSVRSIFNVQIAESAWHKMLRVDDHEL